MGTTSGTCNPSQVASVSYQKSMRHSSPAEMGKVSLDLQSMEALHLMKNPHEPPALFQKASVASASTIPKGSSLLVTSDKDCLADSSAEGLSSLAQDIFRNAERSPISVSVFETDRDQSLEEISQAADELSCVSSIRGDHLVQLSSFSSRELREQPTLSYISADKAISSIDSLDRNVLVAVIDSGIDYTHPDLAGKFWQDSNGNYGHDYINSDSDPMDDMGHGTFVAGQIAAIPGNGEGVAGLTSDFGRLMTIKSFNCQGAGSIGTIIVGLAYAIENNAEVINLSIESPNTDPELEVTLREALAKDIVVVAAAGNSGMEITSSNPVYPAFYGNSYEGVITVGSVNSGVDGTPNTGLPSLFSNFSETYVEIFAPGSVTDQLGLRSLHVGGGVQIQQGTSMAAPQVTAAAAAVISFFKSNNISYDAAEVESVIISNTDNLDAINGLDPYTVRSLNLENIMDSLATDHLGVQSAGVR